MAGIQTIRNNLTGTASKVIVGIIAVTFALFFGGNYVLFDNDANVIASVNSKKIDVFDLDLEMARVQSILRQRFDDPDFSIEEEALRSLALNSLISDALILDFLEQNKVEVLDLSAYKLLAKNEIFQEEGKFSLGKVNTFARQNGFLPGKYIESINEDIAVATLQGTQQLGIVSKPTVDGVFGFWYGKGPGVDRAGDVFRHANLAVTAQNGGVLALFGDDPACKSSTVPSQSEHAVIDAQIPIFNPVNPHELIEFGLYGYAMSRFSGCWIGMKCITDNVDSSCLLYTSPSPRDRG